MNSGLRNSIERPALGEIWLAAAETACFDLGDMAPGSSVSGIAATFAIADGMRE
jgi:hypothetical protein